MSIFVQVVLFAFFFLCPADISASRDKTLSLAQKNLPSRHQQMMNDFDFLANTFHFNYGPAEWKTRHFGWDLTKEISEAKNLLKKDVLTSQKAFHKIIKKFCLSTKDYHVVPQFYSTESSTLPFNIQSAGDKYFISYIDREGIYSLDSFPLSIGDELLLIDGKPISEVAEEFRLNEIGNNYLETDKALTELYFTTRLGSAGYEVPKGSIAMTYCKAFSHDPQVFTIEWNYQSEIISTSGWPHQEKKISKTLQQSFQYNSYRKQFKTPHDDLLRSVRADPNEPSDILGSRKSIVPPLGIVLWESDASSEFYAYLFLLDDWKVGGYVRIPSYNVDSDSAANEFAEIIELFQEVSDVLVVDQINNGGGLVLYMYALAAMLTDYELSVPMHQILLTQEEVYFALKSCHMLESIKNDRAARKVLGNTMEGICVDCNLIKNLLCYHQFIIDQWNSGKLFSDFCYLYGIEKIIPHPEVRYDKPILLLTNNLDFSAADFFPAIMQDNQRATIMGTRTAGAGGYIERISFPNLNGIEEIGLTASFAMRQNGKPIENFGVLPDIHYEITQNDLQNNYVEYKQNILQELKILLTSDYNISGN